MKVSELIKLLSKADKDATVTIDFKTRKGKKVKCRIESAEYGTYAVGNDKPFHLLNINLEKDEK